VQGLFEGAPEAIGNNMFWNAIYAPSNGLIFPSISRRWAGTWGGWVVGEWDCFFGSLLTSYEDKTQTVAAIKAILSAQTETGLVPNIAAGSGITPDRSQPPVARTAFGKSIRGSRPRGAGVGLPTARSGMIGGWLIEVMASRGEMATDGLLEWGSRGSKD
jgi:hypothetical protein